MPISTITRRAALTGTAAGAAAIVAGAGTALADDDRADAELLELERQLEALLPGLSKAMAANSEAHERFRDMMFPQSPRLVNCANDWILGLKPPGTGWTRLKRSTGRRAGQSKRRPRA
jgi:hypothetical protein